ncbi:MAG: hypothetical protein M1296_00040 [Chloroflexi bacterium]|nr:hypothetical protein [Chloroflexota bacterium]
MQAALSGGVGALCAIFSVLVWHDWVYRHRPHQLYWAVALTMACVASASYCLFLLTGRPIFLFRLYYLFGAALNVSFLGLGSIALFSRRPLRALAGVLVGLSLITALSLFTASYSPSSLLHASGAGTNVFVPGGWLILLIVNNTFGTVCLVGIAALTGWRGIRHPKSRGLAISQITIAAGALVVAAAGTTARLFSASGFWVVMLLGWSVLFTGFLLANRSVARMPSRSVVPGAEQQQLGHL